MTGGEFGSAGAGFTISWAAPGVVLIIPPLASNLSLRFFSWNYASALRATVTRLHLAAKFDAFVFVTPEYNHGPFAARASRRQRAISVASAISSRIWNADCSL